MGATDETLVTVYVPLRTLRAPRRPARVPATALPVPVVVEEGNIDGRDAADCGGRSQASIAMIFFCVCLGVLLASAALVSFVSALTPIHLLHTPAPAIATNDTAATFSAMPLS